MWGTPTGVPTKCRRCGRTYSYSHYCFSHSTMPRTYTCNFQTIHGDDIRVIGSSNRITGNRVEIDGDFNTLNGSATTVHGASNKVNGNADFVKGDFNAIRGNAGSVFGNSNTVKGNSGNVNGDFNSICGNAGYVNGSSNRVKGTAGGVNGDFNSVAVLFSDATELLRLASPPEELKPIKPPVPAAIDDEPSAQPGEPVCCICLDRAINTRNIGCPHSCLCVTCARELANTADALKCPKCRAVLKRIERQFYC